MREEEEEEVEGNEDDARGCCIGWPIRINPFRSGPPPPPPEELVDDARLKNREEGDDDVEDPL